MAAARRPKLRVRRPNGRPRPPGVPRLRREFTDDDEGVFCQLFELYPELAAEETRSLILTRAVGGIPSGDYAFVESFCAGPRCDCRRVIFQVLRHTRSSAGTEHVANIGFGWEDVSFYADVFRSSADEAGTIKGPDVELWGPQATYAFELLALFERTCLSEPAYVQRVREHYALFKAALADAVAAGAAG